MIVLVLTTFFMFLLVFFFLLLLTTFLMFLLVFFFSFLLVFLCILFPHTFPHFGQLPLIPLKHPLQQHPPNPLIIPNPQTKPHPLVPTGSPTAIIHLPNISHLTLIPIHQLSSRSIIDDFV
jgi:hypothetical protein